MLDGSTVCALNQITHARSIEEPAVTPENGILAGVGEEPPLGVLSPWPQLLDHETRPLKALLVGMQVPGRRRLAEDIERARLLAMPKLRNCLNQARRHDHDKEGSGHGNVGAMVRSQGRKPRTGSRGTG